MKVTIEITEKNAKDLDVAATQMLSQIGRLAIDINGAIQISNVRDAIVKELKSKKLENND